MRKFILFSTAAALFYMPTSGAWGYSFSTCSTCLPVLASQLPSSHCGFNENSSHDECRASSHVLVGHCACFWSAVDSVLFKWAGPGQATSLWPDHRTSLSAPDAGPSGCRACRVLLSGSRSSMGPVCRFCFCRLCLWCEKLFYLTFLKGN